VRPLQLGLHVLHDACVVRLSSTPVTIAPLLRASVAAAAVSAAGNGEGQRARSVPRPVTFTRTGIGLAVLQRPLSGSKRREAVSASPMASAGSVTARSTCISSA